MALLIVQTIQESAAPAKNQATLPDLIDPDLSQQKTPVASTKLATPNPAKAIVEKNVSGLSKYLIIAPNKIHRPKPVQSSPTRK